MLYGGLTDPLDPDTGGDMLTDGQEVLFVATSPTDPDTDDDGWLDGEEVHIFGTNPKSTDSDGDGIPDPTDPAPNDPLNP